MRTDSAIFADITQKLENDMRIDNSNIMVAIKEGIVSLTGTVDTYTAKLMAEENVKSVRGVKGVAEELEVRVQESGERTDVEIARAARDALEWHVLVPDEHIQLTVENGVLTLTGEVTQNYQRESACSAVRNLHGITRVVNCIKLKPTISVIDVKAKILKEFERIARLDASKITIEVTGCTIILGGKVRCWLEHEEAEKAAWSIPGVESVSNQMTVDFLG